MRTTLPVYQTVFASWGAPLASTFWYRTFPNPNQAGVPGTRPDLSAATFSAQLLDMYDQPLPQIGSLTAYVAGGTGGRITISMTQAKVELIPAGVYRYRIALNDGTGLFPVYQGPFLVTGDAPAVFIAPPGCSPSSCDEPGFGLQVVEEVVADGTLPVLTYCPRPFYLDFLRLAQVSAGTTTVTVLHNGVAVTEWTNVAITTTPQTVAATRFLVTVGDSLAVVFSATSGAADFATTLTGEVYSC